MKDKGREREREREMEKKRKEGGTDIGEEGGKEIREVGGRLREGGRGKAGREENVREKEREQEIQYTIKPNL